MCDSGTRSVVARKSDSQFNLPYDGLTKGLNMLADR